MRDDDDRAACGRPTPSREDQRRWGYDPEVDRCAGGLAQDVRRFGEDHGPRAPGDSYGGWSRAGSMQGRRAGEGPRGDDVRAAAPERRPGPNGGRRSDAAIHDDVCVRLSRGGLDAGDVSVEVRDGQVTLQGIVGDRPTKHAIESLVDACRGVREIDNRIKVMRPAPPQDEPPRPHASVPQDSPSAREEADGRSVRLPRDGSGYYG
jgi:hypothetical protein